MATPFISLTSGFFVAPQIDASDIARAEALGVKLIINNRPDGEEPGQPAGASIKAAAEAAGIEYMSVPVGGQGVTDAHLDQIDAALARHKDAPILAYCRSGTRSATVHALAAARRGEDADTLITQAAEAGYNLAGLRPRLAALSSSAG